MAEAEYETTIAVRFRDLDPMGHVNNAVQLSYIEQARARYFAEVIGEPLHAVDTVLVHATMEYEAPIQWEQPVRVSIDTVEVGTTSITMTYTIFADGERVSAAKTVQVAVDGAGASRPVPDAWRTAMGVAE